MTTRVSRGAALFFLLVPWFAQVPVCTIALIYRDRAGVELPVLFPLSVILCLVGMGILVIAMALAPDLAETIRVPRACPSCKGNRLQRTEHGLNQLQVRIECRSCGWQKNHESAWAKEPHGDW